MVSIEGVEYAYQGHDINSFFNDYDGKTPDRALEIINQRNGLVLLNHPGRYTFPLQWYVDHLQNHPEIIGIEVYNCGDRYPGDRIKWDSLLVQTMPSRPVWGFSNDDYHSMKDFGRNRNIFLLPELSPASIYTAIQKGHFYYVYAPEAYKGPEPPVITAIRSDNKSGTITVEANNADSITWIADGQPVHTGNRFSTSMLSGNERYVRAELRGKRNTVTGTQPFALKWHRKASSNHQ
ncbi:MAG: hypothetical protein LRY55_03405 [Leadbetterella sp.]|nr:hypothetical protein [Leadbetterella sp.]